MKTLSCKDCGYVARGKTQREVLEEITKHGKKSHEMKSSEFTPELRKRLRSRIKEEKVRKAA